MTAKQPTPMPEGIIRPKAPAAPPRKPALANPNNLTLEQAFDIMFERYKCALGELSDR
ncbi:hypothetical protein D3C87_1499200 [compost metagenome]